MTSRLGAGNPLTFFYSAGAAAAPSGDLFSLSLQLEELVDILRPFPGNLKTAPNNVAPPEVT